MGEAKRRKKLDPNYGKVRQVQQKNVQIPTRVPTDYLKYPNFQPCFGYIYCVRFQDCLPALFTVDKKYIQLMVGDRYTTIAISFSEGVATIETQDLALQSEIKRLCFNPEIDFISFEATPNPTAIYRDQNGLSVLPFELNRFCSVEDYHEEAQTSRLIAIVDPEE